MTSNLSSPGKSPTKPFWLNASFLFLFAFGIHFAGTWIHPLQDRDEPRFAEATREMRERQDWFVPYFNNEFRFDKPPDADAALCGQPRLTNQSSQAEIIEYRNTGLAMGRALISHTADEY